MQYLYMMATQIRELEMRKMAVQISKGLLSVDEAMVQYNVASKEAVLKRVEDLKKANKPSAAPQLTSFTDMNIQAA